MNTLFQRITQNWTLRRFFYLGMGCAFIAQGIAWKEWPAIIGGFYFAMMGLFAFGCAGNQCSI